MAIKFKRLLSTFALQLHSHQVVIFLVATLKIQTWNKIKFSLSHKQKKGEKNREIGFLRAVKVGMVFHFKTVSMEMSW